MWHGQAWGEQLGRSRGVAGMAGGGEGEREREERNLEWEEAPGRIRLCGDANFFNWCGQEAADSCCVERARVHWIQILRLMLEWMMWTHIKPRFLPALIIRKLPGLVCVGAGRFRDNQMHACVFGQYMWWWLMIRCCSVLLVHLF
jgi:hypothetical protein